MAQERAVATATKILVSEVENKVLFEFRKTEERIRLTLNEVQHFLRNKLIKTLDINWLNEIQDIELRLVDSQREYEFRLAEKCRKANIEQTAKKYAKFLQRRNRTAQEYFLKK